jgi:hypothetical protein
MPPTKLTLLIDEKIIERAKVYSRRHQVSLSKMVAQFLTRLPANDNHELTPKVRRLSGVLPRGTSRENYRKHLRAKYNR